MEEKRYTSDISGHCNEPTAWQILKEVSEQLAERKQLVVNPFIIEIGEDGHFALLPSETQVTGFDAPEANDTQRNEASTVWSLGATLFHIVMARQVMNGKGGAGQKETSKLPYMRSEWPKMSELVQQCLRYQPSQRPNLQQIHDKAAEQHSCCVEEIRRGPKFKKNLNLLNDGTIYATNDMAFWPETMHETHYNNLLNETK